MRSRPFGNTDLVVSELGFGCARIGGVFQSSQSEQIRLLRQALDSGITLYDTADMYAQGHSERLLGQAFRRDRDQVILASKVGYLFPAQDALISRAKRLVKPLVARAGLRRHQLPRTLRSSVLAQDFSAAYLTRMVEGSLRRLGTDYLDLYQLHSPPREVIERGAFVETLNRLQQQGKIRYWGIACDEPEDALASLRLPGVSAIQVSLSLLHPEALEAAIPLAARTCAEVLVSSPLA